MSKGLEALKNIKKEVSRCLCHSFNNDDEVGCYKPYFDTVEKELKALEIIKRPDFDFNWFKIYGVNLNYEDFIMIMNLKCNIKSKEEYDLLKEVLL